MEKIKLFETFLKVPNDNKIGRFFYIHYNSRELWYLKFLEFTSGVLGHPFWSIEFSLRIKK